MLFSRHDAAPPIARTSPKSISVQARRRVEVGERRDPRGDRSPSEPSRIKRRPTSRRSSTTSSRPRPSRKMIVFSRTKYRADRISEEAGPGRAYEAHRDPLQPLRRAQRQRALQGLRSRPVPECSSRPTSPPEASTSRASTTSSTSTRPTSPRTTSTASAGPAARSRPATPSTFVSAPEADHLRAIEKHTGRRIEQVTYEGFYAPKMEAAMEAASGGGRSSGGRQGQGGRNKQGASGGRRGPSGGGGKGRGRGSRRR